TRRSVAGARSYAPCTTATVRTTTSGTSSKEIRLGQSGAVKTSHCQCRRLRAKGRREQRKKMRDQPICANKPNAIPANSVKNSSDHATATIRLGAAQRVRGPTLEGCAEHHCRAAIPPAEASARGAGLREPHRKCHDNADRCSCDRKAQ